MERESQYVSIVSSIVMLLESAEKNLSDSQFDAHYKTACKHLLKYPEDYTGPLPTKEALTETLKAIPVLRLWRAQVKNMHRGDLAYRVHTQYSLGGFDAAKNLYKTTRQCSGEHADKAIRILESYLGYY